MEPSLIADCTGASMANAIRYADALTQAMDRFEINNESRQAAFLATISVESAKLTAVEEGLYYKDPSRLAKIYPRAFDNAQEATPYARNPDGLSQLLYGGYHGRGLIQLTWEKNYKAAGESLGFDYLGQPVLLLEPEHAALTAGWFWFTNGCNPPADRGDMKAVTRIVNGPALMHLAERVEQFEKNLEALS
jgi:putative chitinase